jgi:hypothetical protein
MPTILTRKMPLIQVSYTGHIDTSIHAYNIGCIDASILGI